MKTEFEDITQTQKRITIEIPSDVVDKEIDRITKGYSKQARLPGFRPGKVPPSVIKQRFRDQILHDVMHALIPRAIEDSLTERGVEPVDTPNVKDVDLKEGQPLKFTAAFETLPPFDPGDLTTISLQQVSSEPDAGAVDQTLQRLRDRAARLEPVEGRPAAQGDTLIADLDRTDASGATDHHDAISIELGAPANPPGFDENLVGMSPGDEKAFAVHFPDDYAVKELAGTDVTYRVGIKELRQRVLPELDDEFAKDLGEFVTLDALRDRIEKDLNEEAELAAKRQVRSELLKQLAQRVTFEVPQSLVEREIDRRLEEFARRLMEQGVDPREANIDWAQFREAQREPARDAVASALVLDEIARRENLVVQPEDIEKEIDQYAARSGRTPAAVRAQLEKDGGLARLSAGLRREKAVDYAMSRAKMTTDDATRQIIGDL
jgi:trigger factor